MRKNWEKSLNQAAKSIINDGLLTNTEKVETLKCIYDILEMFNSPTAEAE